MKRHTGGKFGWRLETGVKPDKVLLLSLISAAALESWCASDGGLDMRHRD